MLECNTRQLALAINTVIHYVLPEELHSYMFQPLSGHLQAVKIHKIKITRLFRMGRSRFQCLSVYICIYIYINVEGRNVVTYISV